MQSAHSKTEKRRALQPLWNAFTQTVKPHENKGLLLAISGGPDSLALMEAFARWPGRAFAETMVVSLDHGVRPNAKEEAQRVVARASVLGFRALCDSRYPPLKGGNGEGQLRKWRYSRLWQLADQHDLGCLVLAQHQDDEAESHLMDLLGLGGGPEGASMGREAKHANGLVLRPFLGLRKDQLGLALSALGLSQYAVTDECDQKNQNWRAFLRNEVMPHLARANPKMTQRLAGKASRQKDVNDIVRVAARRSISHIAGEKIMIELHDLPSILLRFAVHEALRILSPQTDFRQSGTTIDKIIEAAESKPLKTSGFYHFSGVKAGLSEGQLILQRL